MLFPQATFFRGIVMLIFALGFVSGNVAKADNTAPITPTASAIQLNTYGVLPVLVLNLTQSPINFNVSTTSPGAYTVNGGPGMPLAAGLSGVYYPSASGTTTTFTNIYTPATPANGATSASLMPVATAATAGPAGSYTYNNQLNFCFHTNSLTKILRRL